MVEQELISITYLRPKASLSFSDIQRKNVSVNLIVEVTNTFVVLYYSHF